MKTMQTRLSSRVSLSASSAKAWTSDRHVLIGAAVCFGIFVLAMLLPLGWIRATGDHVRINLIDFFIRGVVVPEVLFLAALLVSRLVQVPWLPKGAILCASVAWYFGVLVSCAWLFFVEHVEGTIATTFVDVLTTERLVQIIQVAAAPLSLFGPNFDAFAMVQSAVGSGAPGDDGFLMWRNFVLLALFVYPVLPRLILLAAMVIGIGVGRAVRTTGIAVWKPVYSRPDESSLDWYMQTIDEQYLTTALIVTALGRLSSEEQTPALRAHVAQLSNDLPDNWQRLMADAVAWKAYLAGLTPDVCPKIRSIGFDAARYNFVANAQTGAYALAPQALSRILGGMIAGGKGWGLVHAALADVIRIEKELIKDPLSWKKWFLVGSAGVGAAAGAVVLAPILGTATLLTLGGGAIAKGGLGILGGKLILASAAGTLGVAAGTTVPLTTEATSKIVVQIIARQVALVSNTCVPRATAPAVAVWLQDQMAAHASSNDPQAKIQERAAKRAIKMLKDRALVS